MIIIRFDKKQLFGCARSPRQFISKIAFDEDRMVEILRNCDMSLVITVKE